MKYTSICKKDCRKGEYKRGKKYKVNDCGDTKYIEANGGGHTIWNREYEKFFYTYEEMINIKRTELIDKMLKK